MTLRTRIVSFTLVGLVGLSACKKEKDQEPEAPRISFSPASGPFASLVTITGTGFSPTPAENTVTINGAAAVVQSASPTQLVVEVPVGALSGPVVVRVAGQAAVSSADVFHYLYTTTVSTFAGPGTGYFGRPTGLATDAQGNLFVANASNHTVDKITPAGVRSIVAGTGTAGHVDGPAAAAQFIDLAGIAVDAQGNVYVSEGESYHDIRRITAAGTVTTLAGAAAKGYVDGAGPAARFYYPDGLAVDAQGNVLVADQGNHRIRRVTPAGVVSTFAGTGSALGGFADGAAAQAQFLSPRGVAVDAKGVVYVADANNNRVRKIAADGTVSTLSGGQCGDDDGPIGTSKLYYPIGVAADARGNVGVAEYNAYRIRLISADGFTSTLAGAGHGCSAVYVPGSLVNGPGPAARFDGPHAVAFGAAGEVYVADEYNYCIRKIVLE